MVQVVKISRGRRIRPALQSFLTMKKELLHTAPVVSPTVATFNFKLSKKGSRVQDFPCQQNLCLPPTLFFSFLSSSMFSPSLSRKTLMFSSLPAHNILLIVHPVLSFTSFLASPSFLVCHHPGLVCAFVKSFLRRRCRMAHVCNTQTSSCASSYMSTFKVGGSR